MTSRDRLKALLVAVLWGCNVVAIDIGLDDFPPLFFAGLRFAVIAVPTVLFVRPPSVPWRWVVGYGVSFGVIQFGFLFVAIDLGMPPGLASLVLQSSAPFTVLLGVLLLRERLTVRQVVGLSVAVLGLASVALTHSVVSVRALPVLLTVLAALGWAVGTLCSRLARSRQPLRLVLWMSVVPPVPLFALSLALEGPGADWAALRDVSAGRAWTGVAALGYIVVLTTVVGSGIWSALLSRYPAGVVAPYSLAVPVAGILASWLVRGERPAVAEVAAGVVVVAGLLLGTGTAKGRPRTCEQQHIREGDRSGVP